MRGPRISFDRSPSAQDFQQNTPLSSYAWILSWYPLKLSLADNLMSKPKSKYKELHQVAQHKKFRVYLLIWFPRYAHTVVSEKTAFGLMKTMKSCAYGISGFPIYCLHTWSIKIEKNVIQGDTNVRLHRYQIVHQASCMQFCTVSYWPAQKGTTVPHIWQPPQTTQLAAGIWPSCWVWRNGIQGGVKKRCGEATGEGCRQGPCGRGWVDGGSATVGKLLSVKCLEPLVGTSFPWPPSSSFSSFTSLATTSCFSSLIATSSFTSKGGKASSSCSSISEDLGSVFWLLRSLDRGRPRLTVSMSW